MKMRLYVLRNIRKYVSTVKTNIIGLVVTNVITIPLSVIAPMFFQILLDDVMGRGNLEKLNIVIFGSMVVYASRFLCDWISLKLGNRIWNIFTYNIRKDIWKKYNKVPYSFVEKKEVGELKMRMIDDVDSLGNFINEQVVNYILDILMIVVTFCSLFRINTIMTIYCLLIFPIVFLIDYSIGTGIKKINEEIRMVNSEYYTSTYNSLQFWRDIKAYNSENTFIKRFRTYQSILAKLGFRHIRYWAYKEVFQDFKINYLTKALVYIVGAFFIMKQEISVGELIMFSGYFSMAFTALDGLNTKRVTLKTNAPYYERIFETFDFPEERLNKTEIHNLKTGITVKNVSFSYIEEAHVMEDVNLQINKGDYIAVVGKTGCGKTTLIKLLMGLYKTNKGQILYDGIDINRINKESLYNIVGIVMQDSFLFNVSIRENLLLVNEKATDDEIKEACQKAKIYDFIVSLPNGFETVIGEHGIKLSGGQKQRISIAAALLRKTQIIILDEATSSLDKPSEETINDAIQEIAKDTTVIVITHKPETAFRAKKVVVIENGRITAEGTHEQLLNKNKYYTKLAEAVSNE